VQRREWGRLLRGLFWSGLRLGEALRLTWDWSTGSDLAVDMKAEYPVYRIFAAGEKGARDRILPIAPEFVRMLRRVPLDQRHGLVFGLNVNVVTAVRIISTACRLAGIVVDRDQSNATAHDLRRSFGSRWASRVTPAELQILMRHKSIETTMKYYVELDAISLGFRLANQVARPSGGAIGGAALTEEKDQIVKERRKVLSSKS
jgi:integrase